MKSIYMVTILLVTAFGMSACSSKQTKEVSKTTSESSFISQQRSTSQANSSTKSQTSSSKTTTTDESSSTIQAELKWNSEKKFRLAEFMSAWGKEMNQNYSQYDPTHNVDFYGLSLPFSVLNDNTAWKAAINNQPIDLRWSETGEGEGDYLLVDVYSDFGTKNTFENHVYFFVLKAGRPLVLYTGQNQGNTNHYLHLKETENNELKNAFARIVG